MNDDLIRRSDAIEAIHREARLAGGSVAIEYADMFQYAIKDIPSADRPQGEWRSMGDFERCSVCDSTHLKEFQSYYGKTIWIKTPYCPYCGAKMKGADDE